VKQVLERSYHVLLRFRKQVNWSIIPLTLTFWLSVYLQGEGASLIDRLLSTKQAMIEAGDDLVPSLHVSSILSLSLHQPKGSVLSH
jgi:hypothetical protein